MSDIKALDLMLKLASFIFSFILKLFYDNDNILIKGKWHAAWQTSVKNSNLINFELLDIKQRGKIVKISNVTKSQENLTAGYTWHSKLNLYQGKFLMGTYFPLAEEQNNSKGVLFLVYEFQRKIFFGKWVGNGYDGDLLSGFVVIAKEKNLAEDQLNLLINKYPGPAKIDF